MDSRATTRHTMHATIATLDYNPVRGASQTCVHSLRAILRPLDGLRAERHLHRSAVTARALVSGAWTLMVKTVLRWHLPEVLSVPNIKSDVV